MNTPLQLDLLKNKRQRGIKSAPARERETHIVLADTLRLATKLTGWWWTHIGHGELRTDKTGALLKRLGLKPGIFDFMLVSPEGRVCFLELKRKGGVISDAQALFMAEMKARGISCKVAWNYEEAILQLKEWGVVRVTL